MKLAGLPIWARLFDVPEVEQRIREIQRLCWEFGNEYDKEKRVRGVLVAGIEKRFATQDDEDEDSRWRNDELKYMFERLIDPNGRA
jgi:hypothetical protein